MREESIDRIFTVNLGVKEKERVLVFTDLYVPKDPAGETDAAERASWEKLRTIALAISEAGKRFCETTYAEYPSAGGHGKEPPVEMWRAAFGKKAVEQLEKAGILERIITKTATPEDISAGERLVSVHGDPPSAIVAISHYSTSHTRFRDYLTRCLGVRYASMPLFDADMLTGVMTADWHEVERRTNNLVDMMDGADTAIITSRNGTSISFSMKGRKVKPDTGIITEPGSFSNLPAGEAFLAPVEGTAEGMLVLDWAPTRKLASPVTIDVKEGRVVHVSGDDPFAGELSDKIVANPLCGNIAELGVGTNDRATRPDNILETEKILGTVHIALGDNSSFGGTVSVPFHQDFIFFKPTLVVVRGEEKTEVIVEGEPKF